MALGALFAAYLLNLGLWYWKARQDAPLQARLTELRRLIPADAPVLGNGALWFAFWDRDFTDDYRLGLRRLQAALYPESGPVSWEEECRRLGWRYIVAYGDLRRFLDPEFPLDQVLSLEGHRQEAAEIREARAFSLAHCAVERRLPGFADTITILRVRGGKSNGN